MKNFKLSLSKGLILLVLLIAATPSCKKDTQKGIIATKNNQTAKDGIPTPIFPWYSADYMPTPSGAPSILVPWANGSVRGFDSDIQYDFQQQDGWVLVYNTFDPSRPLPSNPFFVLYNKYRALLRIYVYVNNGGFQNSDYLTTSLNLGPDVNNSNMLNYGASDIVTIGTNQTQVSRLEPTQIATGAWYATQYEIAYDPNIKTSSFTQIGLNCSIGWTNVSTITLGGTSQGSVNGSIKSAGSNPYSTSKLLTGALDATGLTFFSKLKGTDSSGKNNTLGLASAVFNAASTALTGGVSDIVKGLLSGIFGGNSGAVNEQVTMTVNTTYNLTGTSSANGALWPNPGLILGIPGTSNSQSASGYLPAYNTPMGLCYLSSTPQVHAVFSSVQNGPGTKGNTTYTNKVTYSVVPSSIHLIFNPDIVKSGSGGVTIDSPVTEVVGIEGTLTGSSPGYIGTPELVGNLNLNTSTASIGVYGTFTNAATKPAGETIAVRISFHVTPNDNPAAKSLYIKTFYAQVSL